MLKVYFGNDVIKIRAAAIKATEAAVGSGATLVTIDDGSYQNGIYADAIGGASLFGGEQVYLIDTPSNDETMYEDTIENLESFQESNNLFIVIEAALLAPEKKTFSKYADSIEEFKAIATERFNSFALADALTARDKKSLWLLLNEAVLSGIAPEELIGTLWWQLKSLRLAAVTKNAAEAGMKDFPYNKAKRSLGKFKPGEIETLSHSLLTLQHESRLGKRDLDLALERWVLGI
jgi:DNA polymerase III delta subunit